MGNFIADFYCKKLKLVIEVDGNSHDAEEAEIYDAWRQKKLGEMGLTVLRFDDMDVKRNMGYVLEVLERWIVEHEM